MPVIHFELQPIMRADDGAVRGYELLYRGPRPKDWTSVDRSVLRYLAKVPLMLPTLFVNLANESVLAIPGEEFIAANAYNDIMFELSESLTDAISFKAIAEKVNNLAAGGLQFAIDDFGNGLDGLKRVYAYNQVHAIKVDGALLINCMRRPDAAQALKPLIANWRASSILTVAECVENPEIMAFAKEMGFELLQGWHIDAMLAAPALLTA